MVINNKKELADAINNCLSDFEKLDNMLIEIPKLDIHLVYHRSSILIFKTGQHGENIIGNVLLQDWQSSAQIIQQIKEKTINYLNKEKRKLENDLMYIKGL